MNAMADIWQAYENKFSEWNRSSLMDHEITYTRGSRSILQL